MTGAGALASESAYRAGAGLVTWAIPASLAHIGEIKSTETIIWPIAATDTDQISMAAREPIAEASHEANAAILGPGMGVAGETGELIRLLVPEIHAPLVLDAGALSAIGTKHKPLEKRRHPTVLTPHPGEMARLTGKHTDEILKDRKGISESLARSTGTVVVLKGAGTVVTDGEKTLINETGNPGMATGGSGDVLAGVLAGLLAQEMNAFDAAVLAVHLHGAAGDIARDLLGEHSMLASDILRALPRVFLQYQKNRA